MDLIIKNGILITACDTYKADIGIEKGKIVQICSNIDSTDSTKVVDAHEQYILPGVIDAHVHYNLPMADTVCTEDYTTGTKAAACGGVTTIIDFSTQIPGGSLLDSIKLKKEEANKKACIDYSIHAGITDWEVAKNELDQAFCEGVSSFKMFMTYPARGLMSNDADIFCALEETKKRGGVIAVHAESSPLLDLLIERYHKQKDKYKIQAHVLSRPDIIEIEAIERVVRLAELSKGTLYIVHMTTGEGAIAIKKARERGVNVYSETCPQYLLLDETVFDQPNGHFYSTCPQIKSKKNQEVLLKHVRNHDIQVIATDNCTFTAKQKDLWQQDFTKLPFGLPGTETLLTTMYTSLVHGKYISLNHLVELLCSNPAKIYGLYPQKGTLAIGSDADITIFDPEKEVTLDYKNLATNCDWSPYQGMKLHGYPSYTISRGQIVAKDAQYVGEIGHGVFLERGTSCSIL